MNRCDHEAQLLGSLTLGQWPDSAPQELREHVGLCTDCAGLLAVAGALLSDRSELEAQAAPPASGMMWWRMQARMRREAALEAARTVTRVQRLTYMATAAVAIVFASIFSVGAHLKSAFSGIRLPVPSAPELSLPSLPSISFPALEVSMAMPSLSVIASMIAIALIFTPAALYLAFAKD